MLTLSHTVDAHADCRRPQGELARTPQRLLVSAMLAGMWIGVGDVLMWSAGGAFHVAGDPGDQARRGKRVFGGPDHRGVRWLRTGHVGHDDPPDRRRAARHHVGQAAVTLLAIFFANMIGSFALAWVLIQTGILKGTDAGVFWADYLAGKIEHTPSELFWRGVMCNVLVCCAIWAAARLKSEAGKAIIIFWCVLGFVASGFEHVVANMTTFAIGLIGGGVDVTWGDFGINMLTVGLGNLVGGGLVIGLAYAFVAGRVDCPVAEGVDSSRRAVASSKAPRTLETQLHRG